jgi:MoaA/NifB/PqqE/SkfB family radical SAM enzyme
MSTAEIESLSPLILSTDQVNDVCVPDFSIEPPKDTSPTFLWLEITGQCQLSCDHCYANSGPLATQGTMTAEDWEKVIDSGAEDNVQSVQFIGGEPTLNKDLPRLIKHATSKGLSVEVFSNLTHISEKLWQVFKEENVSLATSYYSDESAIHDSITHGNKSHIRTKNNIEEAVKRNVPIRVGIIVMKAEQDVEATVSDLIASGVSSDMIGVDYIRSVGRPSTDTKLDPTQLCGHCGDGVAAILPDGNVSPCVFLEK